jgi:MFS family permease
LNPGRPRRILPVLILSQFLGTSLWFASNAVLPDLQRHLGLGGDLLGSTTSAVQIGFIFGTFFFSALSLPDRVSPRVLFTLCSFSGALFNLALLFSPGGLPSVIVLRFLTGLALAGIYPVGMKIAAGWYREGLGNALGLLVGALVLGTSFPHLIRSTVGTIPWEFVLVSVSAGAAAGGILMLALVSDGPYQTRGTKFEPGSFKAIFSSKRLRSAAFGYFGHMWELYAFYAFLPLVLAAYGSGGSGLNPSFWSFAVIGAGSIGCGAGGFLSERWGSARVAWVQLSVSAACCLLSPLIFGLPAALFLPLMLIWGSSVVGDSPQFSALVATHAPERLVGSALTIVTSIGFAITIVSIELLSHLSESLPPAYLFTFLAAGPVIGLFSSWRLAWARNADGTDQKHTRLSS